MDGRQHFLPVLEQVSLVGLGFSVAQTMLGQNVDHYFVMRMLIRYTAFKFQQLEKKLKRII